MALESRAIGCSPGLFRFHVKVKYAVAGLLCDLLEHSCGAFDDSLPGSSTLQSGNVLQDGFVVFWRYTVNVE